MIEFTKEQKELLVPKIKEYLLNELDTEIGAFEAEFLLEFFNKEIGNAIYNKAIYDVSDEYRMRLESMHEDILFDLEKN